jgi:RNA polymerase sigma-70 factor (ECF subfamily)
VTSHVPPGQVTQLLEAWQQGDATALDRLMPLVYDELRKLASRQFGRESPGHTLQTTALVHEAYLKLVGSDVQWQGRTHFFAVAARAMRHVLVEHARAQRSAKRGGGEIPVTLSDDIAPDAARAPEMLELDEALTRLAQHDERKARIVELHYFTGLGYDEVAELLEISPTTVHRDLKLAKAWLQRELTA